MTNKQTITAFQLFFLLVHMQIGVGVVSLPYDIFIHAKRDSWITILISGCIIQLLILLYGLLIRRFPSQNLFGIFQTLLGKVIGKILILLYCLFYIFLGMLILARFAYLLNVWMMPNTPKWVLLSLMCFTAAFIVKENLQIIARFSFISSIVFLIFIGTALYALKYSTFTYLLPVLSNGIMPVIKSLPPSLFAFQGFELLIFIFPFVKASNKHILKTASLANLFVTFFYLFLVVVSIVFFSSEELKLVPQPVLYLIKAFSFRIIERPDLLFTSMWIVLVATTFILTVYVSSQGLSEVKQTSTLTLYSIVVATIIFIGAMLLNNREIIKSLSNLQGNLLVPFFLGFPIVLLLLAIIMKKKEEVNEQ